MGSATSVIANIVYIKKAQKITGPNPAIKKKVRLNCLKVTIVEFVKKKKRILAPYTPEKKFRLQCVAKKIFRPKEKSRSLLLI